LRLPLGLAAQFPAQKSEFQRHSGFSEPVRPFVRSGVLAQAEPPFAVETQRRSGSFAPRELPRFDATTSLSDCRHRGMRRLCLPCVPCPIPTAGAGLRGGSPGYLACSVVARSPLSPRASWRMLPFVTSPPMAGFTTFGRIAARQWCNEAETGSLALGLATSLSGGYQPPSSATKADRLVSRALSPPHAGAQLHVERTINMCSTSQLHRTRRHSRLNRKTRKDTKISWHYTYHEG
jgi:hypothetical protein